LNARGDGAGDDDVSLLFTGEQQAESSSLTSRMWTLAKGRKQERETKRERERERGKNSLEI